MRAVQCEQCATPRGHGKLHEKGGDWVTVSGASFPSAFPAPTCLRSAASATLAVRNRRREWRRRGIGGGDRSLRRHRCPGLVVAGSNGAASTGATHAMRGWPGSNSSYSTRLSRCCHSGEGAVLVVPSASAAVAARSVAVGAVDSPLRRRTAVGAGVARHGQHLHRAHITIETILSAASAFRKRRRRQGGEGRQGASRLASAHRWRRRRRVRAWWRACRGRRASRLARRAVPLGHHSLGGAGSAQRRSQFAGSALRLASRRPQRR